MTDKKEIKKPEVVVEKPTVQSVIVGDGKDFRVVLNQEYQKVVNDFMGDTELAKKFMSNIIAETQRNPKLMECTSVSLVNAFMTMSNLGLMPSGVMGEAYAIPYNIKGVMTANFQLGYQGVISLLFRAGIKSLRSELVRKNDTYSYINGIFTHEINPLKSQDERGEVIGVFASADYNGATSGKFINITDILKHGKKYSKSFAGKYDSPWDTDPEWMYKKTVIIQLAKLLPKSDKFRKALEEDYKHDSKINNRLSDAKKLSENLKLGNNEKK